MKPRELLLRGYTVPDGDSYFAICLDLNIYARGESPDAATKRCVEFVCDYLNEALAEDREFAEDLLDRKAPLSFWLTYWRMRLVYILFHSWRDGDGDSSSESGGPFKTPLPVKLAC